MNVSLVTVLLTLSTLGAADLMLANSRSISLLGRYSLGDGGFGERGLGIRGVGGLLWKCCSLSKERRLRPSLLEFEFHSNTEADPVLDLGELVRLSIGTKAWPKSGLSRMGILSTGGEDSGGVLKKVGENQGSYTATIYIDAYPWE